METNLPVTKILTENELARSGYSHPALQTRIVAGRYVTTILARQELERKLKAPNGVIFGGLKSFLAKRRESNARKNLINSLAENGIPFGK